MNTRKRKSSHRRHFRRNSYRGGIPDTECSICLEHMSHNDVCTTKCNHKYHLTCMLDWLTVQKQNTCPICKTIIETSNRPNANADVFVPHRENEMRQIMEDRNRNRDRNEARNREIDRVVLGHPNDPTSVNSARVLNNYRQSRRRSNPNRERDEARDREIDRIVLGHNANDPIVSNAVQDLNDSRQLRRQYNSIIYPDDV